MNSTTKKGPFGDPAPRPGGLPEKKGPPPQNDPVRALAEDGDPLATPPAGEPVRDPHSTDPVQVPVEAALDADTLPRNSAATNNAAEALHKVDELKGRVASLERQLALSRSLTAQKTAAIQGYRETAATLHRQLQLVTTPTHDQARIRDLEAENRDLIARLYRQEMHHKNREAATIRAQNRLAGLLAQALGITQTEALLLRELPQNLEAAG